MSMYLDFIIVAIVGSPTPPLPHMCVWGRGGMHVCVVGMDKGW